MSIFSRSKVNILTRYTAPSALWSSREPSWLGKAIKLPRMGHKCRLRDASIAFLSVNLRGVAIFIWITGSQEDFSIMLMQKIKLFEFIIIFLKIFD